MCRDGVHWLTCVSCGVFSDAAIQVAEVVKTFGERIAELLTSSATEIRPICLAHTKTFYAARKSPSQAGLEAFSAS